MLLKVFSVLDSKIGAFGVPFVAVSGPAAQRLLSVTVRDGESLLSRFPEDYALYEIGNFDDQTGELCPCVPVSVCSCVQLKEVVHAS